MKNMCDHTVPRMFYWFNHRIYNAVISGSITIIILSESDSEANEWLHKINVWCSSIRETGYISESSVMNIVFHVTIVMNSFDCCNA
jgi:hypothetical protein